MSSGETRELCTAVEPISKLLICDRDAGHRPPHEAVYRDESGIHHAEWYDASHVRSIIAKARGLEQGDDGRDHDQEQGAVGMGWGY